jgi:hypothetical protein
MNVHSHRPDADRLSIITAMVLLAYALTAFVRIPDQNISLQLPGFLLEFKVNLNTIISLLVAVLAASGTEWLLSTHPHSSKENRIYHWLLPALTAMVIGVPLGTMQIGIPWWVIFTLGGILFSLVLTSEYISLDPGDERYSLAVIGLTAVALALLVILMISLRGSGFRLFMILAAIIPSTALISARCISLRLNGRWSLAWAGVVTLVTAQLSVALYYLPLSPVRYGLILIGFVYGLVTLVGALEEAQPKPRLWVEPLAMTGTLILLAFIVH